MTNNPVVTSNYKSTSILGGYNPKTLIISDTCDSKCGKYGVTVDTFRSKVYNISAATMVHDSCGDIIFKHDGPLRLVYRRSPRWQ